MWKFEIVSICFTALESVATAEVMNIIMKVAIVSMIRAWVFVPEGEVVPSCLTGFNTNLSVNEAEIAPVTWAAA